MEQHAGHCFTRDMISTQSGKKKLVLQQTKQVSDKYNLYLVQNENNLHPTLALISTSSAKQRL